MGSFLQKLVNTVCPRWLHPMAIARRRYANATRGFVSGGPFRGLRYGSKSIGSEYTPKLLGTYEIELREITEQLIARGFGLIVNVGAAEGYYAVGMAVRCPTSKVVAYEADEGGREMTREMA